MIELKDVGGVRVHGKDEARWHNESERFIGKIRAIFDSDAYTPDVQTGGARFVLPCHRGQANYVIHLLESGEALVLKEGRVYICTHRKGGVPRVLTYESVPADRQGVYTS